MNLHIHNFLKYWEKLGWEDIETTYYESFEIGGFAERFYETTNLQHLILPTFYSVLPLLHKRDIITQTSISQTSLFSFVFSSVSESCWLLFYTNHEWKHSLRKNILFACCWKSEVQFVTKLFYQETVLNQIVGMK